ncbi:uncharacterized protein LOC111032244 [Myzus persicae]|uniref:uncharacterized protein LOC111032244 n=1 Tax=Myzus persicae TaxID=13164 RepID=UPI000B933B56|nr:uncharacterized protein LOC111032244 [Myzus persicae]
MTKDTPEELRKLIKKRTTIKASVEVIRNYIRDFDPKTKSIRQVQTRLTKLIDYGMSFDEVQTAIVELNLGQEEESLHLQFEDDHNTLRADMEDLIAKHSPTDSSNVSHSSTGEALRLPTIQPPMFKGNLEDWSSFFDTFNALFHNNTALNDVQRLNYLKTSVSGPAADIIKNFSITAENYQVAYDELVRQYENKGLTIQSHIRALLHSPKANTASAADLRVLHHHVSSHVRALKALGQPVQSWDAWLVTLICGQLDATTAGEWQLRQDTKELPTYASIESFLSKRVAAYEAGIISNAIDKPAKAKPAAHNNKAFFTRSKGSKCPLCSATHKLYSCDQFNKMTIPERRKTITSLMLCYNCLNAGHKVESCYFPSCPKCGLRHNSKIHDDSVVIADSKPADNEQHTDQTTHTVLFTNPVAQVTQPSPADVVMLATAVIYIRNQYGQQYKCRAVLDSGSQLNFIDQRFANRLRLNLFKNDFNIIGVSSMSSSAQYHSQTIISSCHGIPDHLKAHLADPQFDIPGPIEVLLGADIFFSILGSGRWPLSKHSALYQTDFGWIVAGKLPILSCNNISSLTVHSDSALSLYTSNTVNKRSEEIKAETIFMSTYTQNAMGRFIVKLPLNQDPSCLGDSRAMATRRFLNLEKRLIKDSALAESYTAFMNEYMDLGHMVLADLDFKGPTYYLPHHAVFKSDSSTTKVRVVFDGSATASSGLSLNDILIKGPKVQPDLVKILWRFRIHNIAITADVAKMYRQILVSPEDCNLQRIIYLSSPEESLQEYKLTTVTYGTKSASYLATRCLHQVSLDTNNSLMKRIISQDFYVDDLLSGGKTEEECFEIHNQIQLALNDVGFPLRKWCSSSQSLMNRLPDAADEPNFMVNLNEQDTISALGLLWQPITDTFHFSVKDWSPPAFMTKRSLLSDINSIYDPIGLITPVLIVGKIFLQQLWTFKLGWDDILSKDLQARWAKFYVGLQSLKQLKIPRRAVPVEHTRLEIHGFCDASQEAFGCCIYIKSISTTGNVNISLFTSKSRVAPIQASTIPRLELSGALLLAESLSDVLVELNLLNITVSPSNIYLWSDSTIVISWICSNSLFQVYVSNRLARIHDLTKPHQWFYVPTSDNPADLITRGVDASSISHSKLWWHGPEWLSQESTSWPITPSLISELPELRPVKLVLTTIPPVTSWISESYSNWMKLLRITALVKRFIFNCKFNSKKKNQPANERMVGFISVHEIQSSRYFWLSKAQSDNFPDEIAALTANKLVLHRSCLKQLNPFLDKFGLIRVGGRLANAPIADSKKYPIVLPSKGTITKLIFEYEHRRLLHVGPQALLAHINNEYWPIRGRIIAKHTVSNCIQCFRSRPKFIPPFMAPLPRERVTVERPFSRVGVDYCGPFTIRSGLRRIAPTKGYVCVFVCLVTRAVHLELVSSLSSEDFLATLTRFMSRRGQCARLFSDNGTNFVGANRELLSKFREFNRNNKTHEFLSARSITWQFIPPSSPHFGGLWESAVKSAKKHLYCISKGVSMTYDETTTLLCQIEAVLNSRPLTPLSTSPSDFTALTPGHFLVGGPLMLPPELDLSTVPHNRLKRFKLMQAQMQHFWKRWSTEYLPQIQKRGKWTKPTKNFQVGDLAILKDDLLPPIHWNLVRVVKVHPGLDQIVRAVTVLNSSGVELKRPVVKLALLPTSADEDVEPFKV